MITLEGEIKRIKKVNELSDYYKAFLETVSCFAWDIIKIDKKHCIIIHASNGIKFIFYIRKKWTKFIGVAFKNIAMGDTGVPNSNNIAMDIACHKYAKEYKYNVHFMGN